MSVATFGAVVALAAQGARTAWDGVYTAAQATRGSGIYMQHCDRCHGAALEGIEAAPALTGTTFMSTWEGVPLGDLAERIRVSMPQDRPGSLSRQQTADLLAYLLDVGKFPPGPFELPADATLLSQITLRSSKP